MYGAAQFAQAAARSEEETGVRVGTIFGAELSLDLTGGHSAGPEGPRASGQPRCRSAGPRCRSGGRPPGAPGASPRGRSPAAPRAGVPDPAGQHLLVLARDPEGYRRLCRVISAAQLAGGEKGRPSYDIDVLASAHGGHWVVLTGCRKGAVPAALAASGPEAALGELHRLAEMFGRGNVMVELIDHDQPADDERNDALYELAMRGGMGVVASSNVHYAAPAQARLAQALAAVRARASLDEMNGWLPASGSAYLRSGAEMAQRLTRFPVVFARSVELARECAFSFKVIAPELPDWPVPESYTQMSWLRKLVAEKVPHRYGPPDSAAGARGVPADRA